MNSDQTAPQGVTESPSDNRVFVRPVIGPQEVEQTVKRLVALYERLKKLQIDKAAQAQAQADPVIWATPFKLGEVPKSRLASVDDAVSGLEYAAWCIGETLCAIGGVELMHVVFAMFEDALDHEGSRAGSWLDHRWSGVCVRDEIWCC
jgi:hypothetical protein